MAGRRSKSFGFCPARHPDGGTEKSKAFFLVALGFASATNPCLADRHCCCLIFLMAGFFLLVKKPPTLAETGEGCSVGNPRRTKCEAPERSERGSKNAKHFLEHFGRLPPMLLVAFSIFIHATC